MFNRPGKTTHELATFSWTSFSSSAVVSCLQRRDLQTSWFAMRLVGRLTQKSVPVESPKEYACALGAVPGEFITYPRGTGI